MKKAEDGNGIIVRLYEVNNSRTSVTLASDGTLSEARETDLLENPELIKKAHKDWLEELDGETYPNPLPKDAKPELW